MRTLKFTLQYDGTGFAGFQRQPNGVTVQERLEDALRAVACDPGVKIGAAAGRTDAGVHARGQVVHFRTERSIPIDRWPYALNQHLPPEIVVVKSEQVEDEFHARYWAISKWYRYTVDLSPFPVPLTRLYACHWPRSLDLVAMRQASGLLLGTHDFAAFRSTGGSAKRSVRTVSRLEVAQERHLLYLDVEADGFLYNMVRIIAGTLLEVGTGKRTLREVAAAIATGDRNLAGKTLPPHGLCLEEVRYTNGPRLSSHEDEEST